MTTATNLSHGGRDHTWIATAILDPGSFDASGSRIHCEALTGFTPGA